MKQVWARHLGMAVVTVAGALLLAPAAQATQVFFNPFVGLNGGLPAENFTPGGFTVLSGSVDLLSTGLSGVSCFGGKGQCIDLEGANGYGRLQVEHPFAVKAGDRVTLSFELSGNQRIDSPFIGDQFQAGFRFSTPTDITLDAGGPWPNSFFDPPAGLGVSIVGSVSAFTGFNHYSLSFVAPQDVMVGFRIGGGGIPSSSPAADGFGAILDNVSLDITPGTVTAPVPEPTAWALMLMGFGGLGAALRRRRAALV